LHTGITGAQAVRKGSNYRASEAALELLLKTEKQS
jgi:hypothetical protein